MQTFLVTLLLLGVLIFVHELGHFLAAKWAGISVPRFSLGLGPRLVGFRIGETDYCLSAIPFGGYVKMAGVEGEEDGNWMEGDKRAAPTSVSEPTARTSVSAPAAPTSVSEPTARTSVSAPAAPTSVSEPTARTSVSERSHGPEEFAGIWIPDAEDEPSAGRRTTEPVVDPSRGFDSKPLWKRLIVILAGVTMNFLFGYAIFVWLSWAQGVPQLPTTLGTPDARLLAAVPEAAEWRGRTVRAVNGRAVEDWDKLAEAVQLTPPGEAVRLTFASGEEAEARVEPEVFLTSIPPALPPVVGEVVDDGPADRGGVRPGDRIVALDGQPVRIWEDIPQHVRARAGEPVTVRLERGGRELEVQVVPTRERAPGPDNKFVEVGFFGVGAKLESHPLGFADAVREGTLATIRAGGLILHGLGQLLTGAVSFDSIGGPVAIGQITGYYQRQGFDQLLWWMGLFSINLAILNLLPIPVLDGGHVVFFLLPEAVRGRPLPLRLKTRIALAGWVVVGLLMAWAVTSDLTRLVRL